MVERERARKDLLATCLLDHWQHTGEHSSNALIEREYIDEVQSVFVYLLKGECTVEGDREEAYQELVLKSSDASTSL